MGQLNQRMRKVINAKDDLVLFCNQMRFGSLNIQDRDPKSNSQTFYEQLLCAQIPKAQKVQSSGQSFLLFWDICV